MTENESKTGNVAIVGGGRGSGKIMKIQLDLLKELEAYRALGTVEEIQKAIEGLPLHQVEHKLLQEYQNIGTVRGCRVAVERMKTKSRVVEAGMYYCCTCRRLAEESGHCRFCGQSLY